MFASTCSSNVSMRDCVCVYVCDGVQLQLATTCNPLRRKPQLRNSLDQAGLWACLWVIVFTVD